MILKAYTNRFVTFVSLIFFLSVFLCSCGADEEEEDEAGVNTREVVEPSSATEETSITDDDDDAEESLMLSQLDGSDIAFASSSEPVAQSFSVSSDFDVTRIAIYGDSRSGMTGELCITITQGSVPSGSGAVNISESACTSDLTLLGDWIEVEFDAPVSLTAGDYWILVFPDSGFDFHEDASAPYDDGILMRYASSGISGSWVTTKTTGLTCDGGNAACPELGDMKFKIFGNE